MNLFATILTTSSMDIDRKIWQTVWQNFFMVVPVVSITFHSFDNMFKYFNHNNISWLIIDEAGQAQPQYAASAIYKSKNVVVVGDPMQTQPVSTLKQKLIEKLCEKFSVSFPDWSPSKVSMQHLADRNSLYQTKYNKTLVGFPLLVHRRCQNLMFDICNKIAYDDKMIFAVSPPKSVISDILGNSRWINVADNNSTKGKHESKAEFDVLYQLLKSIVNKPNSKELLECNHYV
ncbi:hypothetical protein RAS_12840 [Rickettsia asiatica]|uniref:DNA2/NAM7 helicase helicase domain-containing protein n=1 Tax=Rickettsia asiatica TaxID=238800 RepID=A0A510GB67_9RICK|nr:AAA domain-containing protein [Rickettsia asiatica]BBJ32175.1 hypothetical protein RAS_12840 [Rickettsia asiatica]